MSRHAVSFLYRAIGLPFCMMVRKLRFGIMVLSIRALFSILCEVLRGPVSRGWGIRERLIMIITVRSGLRITKSEALIFGATLERAR